MCRAVQKPVLLCLFVHTGVQVLALHGALQLASHPEHREPAPAEGSAAVVGGPYGPTGVLVVPFNPPPRPPGLVAAAPGSDRPSTFRAPSPAAGPPCLPGLPIPPSLPVNNNSFGLATAGNPLPLGPGLEEAMAKIEIEVGNGMVIKSNNLMNCRQVNESLVGAVLGPAGRHIVEIQQYRWMEWCSVVC